MPRTIAAECPGCPPVRALTTDVLGLVKVVEARGKAGTPKVVETWGSPDASLSVLAASFLDRKTNPLMVVARKNGLVEFLNPLNGDILVTTRINESSSSSCPVEDDAIAGLHLLRTKTIESPPELSKFLTCTVKGKACLRSIAVGDPSPESVCADSTSAWDVCNSGKVVCSSVDDSGQYALFGGNRIEVNVWDLDNCTKIWTAKPPPCNSLQIFSPTWFTAATFLNNGDHHKIAAGTNNHQIRLYDTSAQRRPVISVSFRESPIKAVTADPDGYRIYIGTGYGDIASFDMRTGKLLGCFLGKCSGSVRSIVRHPELPLIASCGLDRYLRFWDTETRQLLSAVFLKQHLTNVMIDSHFSAEGSTITCIDQANNLQVVDHTEVEDDEELLSEGTRTPKREEEPSKMKTKKSKKKFKDANRTREAAPSSNSEAEDNCDQPPSRRRKQSEEREQSRRIKQKKGSKKNL